MSKWKPKTVLERVIAYWSIRKGLKLTKKDYENLERNLISKIIALHIKKNDKLFNEEYKKIADLIEKGDYDKINSLYKIEWESIKTKYYEKFKNKVIEILKKKRNLNKVEKKTKRLLTQLIIRVVAEYLRKRKIGETESLSFLISKLKEKINKLVEKELDIKKLMRVYKILIK